MNNIYIYLQYYDLLCRINSFILGMRELSRLSRKLHICYVTEMLMSSCVWKNSRKMLAQTKYCSYIYIRLKIKPNSVRIRSQSCQFFVLHSTGFEPTPLTHCSTIRLPLRPVPQTTRPHPLPLNFLCLPVSPYFYSIINTMRSN